MLSNGILKESSFQSVIASTSTLKPKGSKSQRNIVADLLLTALIDAFSILVIFLLMNFSSTGEIVFVGKGTELPKAFKGEMLEHHPVVKIEDDKIYLENKVVTQDELVPALLVLREDYQKTHSPEEPFPGILTVQADRRLKYEMLNSVVLASSHAGFSDIKFAVILK